MTRQRRIAAAIDNATMHFAMARAATPYLKRTDEYAAARADGRARAWLDAESQSIGYALAEVLRDRLAALDPDAGATS